MLAEQTLLPREIRRKGVDLLHNLFTTAPAAPGVPQVTTILDVIYKRLPGDPRGPARPRARRSHLDGRAPLRPRDRNLGIGEDRTSFASFDVPAERIDVTYPGPALRADASVAEGLSGATSISATARSC